MLLSVSTSKHPSELIEPEQGSSKIAPSVYARVGDFQHRIFGGISSPPATFLIFSGAALRRLSARCQAQYQYHYLGHGQRRTLHVWAIKDWFQRLRISSRLNNVSLLSPGALQGSLSSGRGLKPTPTVAHSPAPGSVFEPRSDPRSLHKSWPKHKGMRIATLQIAPKLGDVEGNIKRADELLSKGISIPDEFGVEAARVRVEDAKLDLLVLPELALTGYNFPSLEAIKPYLEPAGKGRSATWARETAKRLGCKVCVGYPEVEVETNGSGEHEEKYYNSLLVLDEQGNVLLNYRKTFLYYTDETWAEEGSAELGFHQLTFPNAKESCGSLKARAEGEAAILPPPPQSQDKTDREIATSFGICMDINPYRFEAPYTAYEFAHRVLESKSQLVILSMAWLTLLSREELDALAEKPEIDTFNYWIQRFMPLITKQMNHSRNADDTDADAGSTDADKRIIIVFANRAGEEDGSPSPARYAGTSTIVAVSQRQRTTDSNSSVPSSSSDDVQSPPFDVKILCWDMLGATEEGLCFADTAADPKMAFQLVRASR